jgi:hypothetical protein
MTEYECVRLGNYKEVGPTIKEYQDKGWQLHT